MRLVIVRPGRKVFLPLSLARVVPEYARSFVVGAKNLSEKGPLEIPEDQNQRTLAGGDQEEEPPDCSGFEDSTI